MSKLAGRMLFSAICIVFSFSANAFDLNGTWTADDKELQQGVREKNNKIAMTRNSDVFGGGFIVEGNQMRGQAKTCKITSRKRKAAFCI